MLIFYIFTSIFKRIYKNIGIKNDLPLGGHIHMTRHTFVTRLIEMGISKDVISNWCGHTTIMQIDKTYGHILEQFKNWQLENHGEYYKKEQLISPELKEKLLNIYNL